MFNREKARQLVDRALGKNPKTKAQECFNGVTILTSRPNGMSPEEYKKLRKLQQKTIRQCLR